MQVCDNSREAAEVSRSGPDKRRKIAGETPAPHQFRYCGEGLGRNVRK